MKAAVEGFTLIELAIVIALISILSTLAVLRFADLQDNAHRSMAQRFLSQLISAAAVATAETSTAPTAFTQFVSTSPASVGTVSVAPFTYVLNIPLPLMVALYLVTHLQPVVLYALTGGALWVP
jgi:prepilin-type N-terminal cleavage/methylation domain-containing protein